MSDTHEKFMRLALQEATKAGAEGNIAVGAVIVRDDVVLARGRNLVESTRDPTAHAEIVALRDATASLEQVDLSGCRLYTTWEPCPMCLAAILVARIATLVMGSRESLHRWGPYTVERFLSFVDWDGKLGIVTGVLPEECTEVYRKWGGPEAGTPPNTRPRR